jgi:hypothetical protein
VSASAYGFGDQNEPTPLTDKEIQQLQRLLSDPFNYPPELWNWIKTKMEDDPPAIAWDAILGFSGAVARSLLRFRPLIATKSAEVRRASTTFGDPNNISDPGPEITDLTKGTYLVIWGGSSGGVLASNVITYTAIAVNGTPDTSFFTEAQQEGHASVARAGIYVLPLDDDANVVKMVYANNDGSARGDTRHRWIVAIRMDDQT